MNAPNRQEITDFFRQLQDEICTALADYDGGEFREDSWERPGGGGGRARVLNGNLIEKGGVNFSAVHGELPPAAAASLKTEPEETNFYATGVSIVLHPRNVHVPIIHMNVRYFELDGGRFWFGGGIDLTPALRRTRGCALVPRATAHDLRPLRPGLLPQFKNWADDYFYLPHREETRGVGGIFYDRLTPESEGKSKRTLFEFTQAVGRTFAPTYLELLGSPPGQTGFPRRSPLAATPPGPLRGIQPGVGPGHEVRTDHQRPHGEYPDEPAAASGMDVRLPGRTGQPGGGDAGVVAEGGWLGRGLGG